MEKYAAIKTTSSKLDRLIIEQIANCCNLRTAIDAMLSKSNEDNTNNVSFFYEKLTNNNELIKNAIITLVKQITSDSGEIEEVDVEVDEDGIRFQ